VYEQILRIPYYAVFDRYQNQLRAFRLVATRYEELALSEQKLWFDEIELGLGIWRGSYEGTAGLWLRWFDVQGNWLSTPVERERQRVEEAHHQAQQERQRAERLAARLRELGIEPDEIPY
jgi:hypothetical protein